MANVKISELNELLGHQKAYEDVIPIVDTSANETKKISVKGLIPSNVKLIAITDTAPIEYETGDKYYNTTTDKIYTGTSYDRESPEDPVPDIFYVILEDQKTYTYDHINHEMISVGGGSGGIVVAPDEPEEDTKIYIEEEDLDFQGLPISSETTTGSNITYSADYINNMVDYSTTEVNTGKKWTDGSTIYRKVFTGNLSGGAGDREIVNLTSLNISTITNIYGWIGYTATSTFSSGSMMPINTYYDGNFYSMFYYYSSQKKIFCKRPMSDNLPYQIILEYTKTS